MRSLTEMVVAALGVEDTEAGDDVDTASSAVIIGPGMAVSCVGSVVVLVVVVSSVVIFFCVVVVSRRCRGKESGYAQATDDRKRAQLVRTLGTLNIYIYGGYQPITAP